MLVKAAIAKRAAFVYTFRAMKLTRSQRMTCALSVIVTLAISLCPHALHRTLHVHEHASEGASTVLDASEHGHTHCEQDALHSHELRLTRASDFRLPYRVALVTLRPVPALQALTRLMSIIPPSGTRAGMRAVTDSIPLRV